MTPSLCVDARARLGECALWCDSTQSLWWTDIESATISRWRPADGEHQTWAAPGRVGSFALCDDPGHLLLGTDQGVGVFDLDSGELTSFRPLAMSAGARINDGRCDRQGRFVFGLFHPPGTGRSPFYRVNADLTLDTLPLPAATVANGLAFSPDGNTLYFTDSPRRVIWRVPYGADGALGTPEPFVHLGGNDGFADGATVDADGGLWSARWLGGCVVRHDAQGRETLRIALPVSCPTCPTLGGPSGSTLFVTSARDGLDAVALAREPAAGGIWALDVPHHGLPETRFRLAP